MSNFDSAEVGRGEYLHGEARKYLGALEVINNFVKEIGRNNGQVQVVPEVREAAEVLVNVQKFLEQESGLAERVLHDTGNSPSTAISYLDLYIQFEDQHDAENLLKVWDRYKVAVGDNLLRILDEKRVHPEFARGVDLDVLKNVVNYFLNTELDTLYQKAKEIDSAYTGLREGNRRIKIDVDWDKIKDQVKGRKIKGNTDLIGNFILNALRNPLKAAIDARLTTLSIKVEDDELVLRIDDDGVGMDKKYLDPQVQTIEGKSMFIFGSGVSNTGSTGLGLADFDSLLASADGSVYVVSKKAEEGSPVRFQCGGAEAQKEAVKFDHQKSGTTFELRLKLEEF